MRNQHRSRLAAAGLFALLLASPWSRGAPIPADKDGPAAPAHGVSFGKIDSRWVTNSSGEDAEPTEPANLVLTHLAGVRATVRAEVAPTGKTALEFATDRIALVTGVDDYKDVGAATTKIGANEVPGLSVLQRDATGVEYRVRQFFVIENGMLYTLQEVATSKEARARESLFDALWQQIRFDAPSPEVAAMTGRRSLAARCGSELELASSWEEARRRAQKSGRPVLVMMRLYSGLPDADVAAAGPWMDEDVVQLVRLRFVPMRYTHGMDVPFSSYELYGLSPTSFGSTALVVTPEGKVLGDTFVADAFSLCDALRAALPAEFAAQSVEERIAGGDYDGAAKLIGRDDTARGHRLRADLLRRRRDGDGALAELNRARAEADDADKAAIDVDIALIMLRQKRTLEADALLKAVIESKPSPAVTARALWWRGAGAAWRGDHTTASAEWERLMNEFPDDRNAWRAAAERGGLLFSLGGGEPQGWPTEDLLASVKMPPKHPLAREQWKAAERGAIDFLLRTQKEDGSWWNPMELEGGVDSGPNAIQEASDAICGLGLLEHKDQPKVKAAVERTLDGLLARAERWPQGETTAFYMDYSAWRHAYVLRFFAACLHAKVGDAARLQTACADLLVRIASIQQPGGGWTYIYTSKMSGDDAPVKGEPSLSFVTGAVAGALQDAREHGVKIEPKVLERALDCLEAMEGDNGGFAYLMMPGTKHAGNEEVPGAAGRIPLCVHVLAHAGRRKPTDVAEALDAFLDHGALLAREQGKTLMHSGPDGQGSHYLYFDYANTALALRHAPAAARAPVRERVLDYVLAGRLEDGSFVDNPLLGRPVATGFALVAFTALR